MAMEIGRTGTMWICYGQMPALERLPEGSIVPAESLTVTDVVPYTVDPELEEQTLEATIHNASREGTVLLGVIGGYPLDLTAADASHILNARNNRIFAKTIGHFPIQSKELVKKVLDSRWIDARIEPLLFKNTMFPESVPPIEISPMPGEIMPTSGTLFTRKEVKSFVNSVMVDLFSPTFDESRARTALKKRYGIDVPIKDFKNTDEIVKYIMEHTARTEAVNPAPIVPMTREALKEHISKIMCGLADPDNPENAHIKFQGPEWNVSAMVNSERMVKAVREQLGINIRNDHPKFDSVDSLVDYIMDHLIKTSGSKPVTDAPAVAAPMSEKEIADKVIAIVAKQMGIGVDKITRELKIDTDPDDELVIALVVLNEFNLDKLSQSRFKTVGEIIDYIVGRSSKDQKDKPAAKASPEILIGTIGSVDLASMSEKEIEEKVKAIISDQLGIPAKEIASISSFTRGLHADPGDVLMIFAKVQTAFGLDIRQEEVAIRTVNDLVEYVIKNRKPS